MRHWPLAMSVLPSDQNEAVQFAGLIPLPIREASDSALHQSRSSDAELIGVSRESPKAMGPMNSRKQATERDRHAFHECERSIPSLTGFHTR